MGLIFEQFISDRNLKENTAKLYRSAIRDYENFHKTSIEDLIQEADDEEEQRIRQKNRKIKRRLLDYRNYKIQHKTAYNTIMAYFALIKTVYRHFDIEIPNIPPAAIKKEYQETYSDIPTLEEIREVYENISNPMYKAIILFIISSGSALNETSHLTIKQFITATKEYHSETEISKVLDQLEDKDDIVPIFEMIRIKTDYQYYTCCSPEAVTAIIKYLRTRTDLKNSDKIFDVEKHSIFMFFNRINKKFEFGNVGHRIKFHSHALRKFNANAIGDKDLADAIQGRKPSPVKEAYFKSNPARIKKQYMEHLNKLTLEEIKHVTLYDDESKKLKTDIDKMKQELNELYSIIERKGFNEK